MTTGISVMSHMGAERRLIGGTPSPGRRCYAPVGVAGVGCAATRAAVRAGTRPGRAAMVRVRAAVFLCAAAGVIAAAPLAACTAGGHAPPLAVSVARSSPRAAASGGSLAAGSVARFAGVSCTSASACTAVGSTEVATLAERWDGRRWAIQQTPSPGSGAALSAVSCAGPAWCMAVGSSGSLGSQTALAELWNGRTWSVRLPVTPPHGHARLLGVSCPEPGEVHGGR